MSGVIALRGGRELCGVTRIVDTHDGWIRISHFGTTTYVPKETIVSIDGVAVRDFAQRRVVGRVSRVRSVRPIRCASRLR
jgi:hypothetical protein